MESAVKVIGKAFVYNALCLSIEPVISVKELSLAAHPVEYEVIRLVGKVLNVILTDYKTCAVGYADYDIRLIGRNLISCGELPECRIAVIVLLR